MIKKSTLQPRKQLIYAAGYTTDDWAIARVVVDRIDKEHIHVIVEEALHQPIQDPMTVGESIAAQTEHLYYIGDESAFVIERPLMRFNQWLRVATVGNTVVFKRFDGTPFSIEAEVQLIRVYETFAVAKIIRIIESGEDNEYEICQNVVVDRYWCKPIEA